MYYLIKTKTELASSSGHYRFEVCGSGDDVPLPFN